MQRFTTKIMPLVPRKTYRSVLMKGPNPDFGRMTSKPEVGPGQKSASGNCGAADCRSRPDLREARFSLPYHTAREEIIWADHRVRKCERQTEFTGILFS
jgi:hypothetical protein